MKNNILLIAAVTIISLGIIIAAIVLSSGGSDKPESSTPASSAGTSSSASSTYKDFDEPSPRETAESEPPAESTSGTTSQSTTEQTSPPEQPASSEPEVFTPEAEAIISTARSLIGVEFADDGDTPAGFDNSGFIYYVLRENGYITCPRGVAAQAEIGTALGYNELKAGDLVYFANESGTGAGFGGIYIGGGKMIACLMPGTNVREIDITSDYYKENFYRGVSLS